ncbi:SusD/RagB family nutrient-binding outer membrane lipoprotein [Chitinophaga niastensis]|nr:SusD/RagB family nutrient-binding outer membrane lipoprotein [Chitinophaga niastensis]
MNNIKTFALFGCIIFASTGCKKFLDVNTDPNNPLTVKEAQILAPVEINTSTLIVGGASANITAYWMQQLSINQPVPSLESYNITSVDANNTWGYYLYASVFENLRIMIAQAQTAKHYEYVGIGKTLFAYNLAITTDLWNNIPYTEGFNIPKNMHPKYDSQEAIYTTIQTMLDSALYYLHQLGSKVVPGADDYIYNGDVKQWEKFVYTLKARYYLRLTKAPGRTASLQADSALAALQQGLGANTDNALVAYPGTGQAESPWFVNTGEAAGGVVMAKSFIDSLITRNDPRLPVIATKNKTGIYVGRKVGDPLAISPDLISKVNTLYAGADANLYLATYSEALFIKAEATFIKQGAAAAAPVYQAAIAAHMTMLGIPAAAQQTYIASRPALTAANALQQIITEKYVADFLSPEVYNDWRRTGYPQLMPYQSEIVKSIPRRWPYPASELLTNPQPDQKATLADHVWWDAN